MTELLAGAPVAAALDVKTKQRVTALTAGGVVPTLAMVRVGHRGDDIAYERGAMNRCAKVGVAVQNILLPETVGQDELLSQLRRLNQDPQIHGVLLFRPLPPSLDEAVICAALAPEKDVDGITAGSMAGVFMGTGEGFAPCTAQSCMEILHHYGVAPAGKRAAVVGRSLVVGRPVAMLLLREHATVTICHTGTRQLAETVRGAELVVAAAGAAETVTCEYLSKGQVVVDVGINWNEGKQQLVGDVDFDAAQGVVSAITPVPGGVGAVTTAVLASHVVEAAEKLSGSKPPQGAGAPA